MPRRENIGLIVFFLIAFGIPWAGWMYLNDEMLSLWLFPLFCSIAGFAATYVECGTDGLRRFCQRTLRLSGAIKWMLPAALIPLALGFIYLAGTGVSLSSLQFPIEAVFSLWLLAALVTGPLAEEFGWRGYLQNKLLGHMRPIWVALALGTIWCIWHIPLYYASVFSLPSVCSEIFGLYGDVVDIHSVSCAARQRVSVARCNLSLGGEHTRQYSWDALAIR